jgi:hypothetical protein
MADYYPLIARAVAGLERNSAEARRALYERARAALVAQLRGVVPPLEESEITRERLALEESIRKVEAEAARQARPEIPRAAITRPPRPSAPPPSRPPPATSASGAPSPAPPPAETAPQSPAPIAQASEPQGPAAPALSTPGPAASDPATPASAATGADSQVSPPIQRPARRREAPPVEHGGARTPAASARPERKPLPDSKPPRDPMSGALDLDALAQTQARKPGRDGRDAIPPVAHDFDQLVAPAEARLEAEPPRPAREKPPKLEFEPAPQLSGGRPSPMRQRARPQPHEVLRDDEEEGAPRVRRSYRGLIKTVIALLILGTLSAGAYWQRTTLSELYHAFMGPSAPVPREVARDTSQATRPKISDRIGPAGQDTSQQTGRGGAVAPVAQRVVLYEEEPSNPEGKRFIGTVVWRTETVSPGPGLPPELAVKADIEIPEYKITATWSIRRNLDKTLPASHTIEIMFNLPADFAAGGISNVPGILMKQAEQTRGVPLAGLAVKVTTGFFLIGLSAVEADMQRNIQLLKERSWFDIPLVYNNNRRAILALEKGTPGERVFAEAFAAWRQ